jgi:S-formylglutathione hydrolase
MTRLFLWVAHRHNHGAMRSEFELSDLSTSNLPEAVPYAIVTPPGYRESGAVPLCLLLMGGGGSRQSLIDCQPWFDAWWSESWLAPMVLATPSAGMSYYVEDPEQGVRWESFLMEDFIPHLRQACHVGGDRGRTAIVGMSMGGYGALKIAFAHPDEFAAVAVMNPMLEPGCRDSEIGARNRLHHSSGGPARLIGPGRDPLLFAANNPANRAQARPGRIRESGLAIYLEVGDHDFVNAHDGTEFLHRVLWDLDISHEYRLVRNGDHGGPTFRPRLGAMFRWLSAVLTAADEPGDEERAFSEIRGQLQAMRERAAAVDPTTARRFGVLPRVSERT